MCDNSSSTNEASMTCDSMTRHLKNDAKYLRVAEVNFFGLFDYCKCVKLCEIAVILKSRE